MLGGCDRSKGPSQATVSASSKASTDRLRGQLCWLLTQMTRRDWMAALTAAGFGFPFELAASDSDSDLLKNVVRRHDDGVERLLKLQISDAADPHRGIFGGEDGLFYASSAAGLIDAFNAAFHQPLSKFHHSALMVERLKFAAKYITAAQSPEGNIDNPITNFNSPPDTAFSVLGIGRAAAIAKKHGTSEISAALAPFLQNAARGLTEGGIHTPNHRWVVCAALATIHQTMPEERLVKRVDQWLAEGIDIDADGQYDER